VKREGKEKRSAKGGFTLSNQFSKSSRYSFPFQEMRLAGGVGFLWLMNQATAKNTTNKVAGTVRPLRTKRTNAASKTVKPVHFTLRIMTDGGSWESLKKNTSISIMPINARKKRGIPWAPPVGDL